jgi:EAL domain-containing protein (putative c-di-GMP-specific phosphodiesterase class I)
MQARAMISTLLSHIRRRPPGGRIGAIARIVQAVRTHLGMDVAFVAEFIGERLVFRQVDAAATAPMAAGDSCLRAETLCGRVVDGRLPGLIRDTLRVPAAQRLTTTTTWPVGAHLSVPIRLQGGRVYGTLCCFNHAPDPSLNQRDLQVMAAFAELLAHEVEREWDATHEHDEMVARIRQVLTKHELSVVYQPVYSLDDEHVIGFEALARFRHGSPDEWFASAAKVGLGKELELAAIRQALEGLSRLQPAYVAVNVSPDTILCGELTRVLRGMPGGRVVLELTEHSHVADYGALIEALAPLRAASVRVAVDDAGAGFASMRHVLRLHPDLIKLDASLIRGIEDDSSKRALTSAMVVFARETDSVLIAEGVETAAELAMLRSLDIKMVQGYLFARPMLLEKAAALIDTQSA